MTAMTPYEPTNFIELEKFAKRISSTGLVPAAYKNKPDDIMSAIILGAELGLRPLSSLNSLAVINGRPAVWGDALPGLAISKGLIKDIRERFEGKPYDDDFTAICEVERPNGTIVTQRFSVADAKKANLWGKAGPWQNYSRRMLQIRARSFAIRDAAPHLLFGNTAEELQDIEISEQHQGPDNARDITPEAPSPSPRASVDAVLAASQEPQDYDDDGVIDDDQPSLLGDLPEQHDPDPLKIDGLKLRDALSTLEYAIAQASAVEADQLLETYRAKLAKAPDAFKALADLVAGKIAAAADDPD